MIAARTAGLVVATLMGCACNESTDNDNRIDLRDVTTLGTLGASKLVEASGAATSTRLPNVFWSQNDSGNDDLIFAFDSTGGARGTLPVTGARNRDWEALAIGPCVEGSCLFIADVGDNNARRSELTIWRVPEPLPTDTATLPATPLRFRYEDGSHDVEAMWIAPDSAVLLLTKRPIKERGGRRRMSLVYRLAPSAWNKQGIAEAALVDSVPIVPSDNAPNDWITDASLSSADSTGARLLAVRTYADVFIFAADASTGRPLALVRRCSLRTLHEQYGEGVTWLPGGRLLFVAEGRSSVLHAGRCRGP